MTHTITIPRPGRHNLDVHLIPGERITVTDHHTNGAVLGLDRREALALADAITRLLGVPPAGDACDLLGGLARMAFHEGGRVTVTITPAGYRATASAARDMEAGE
ncbi:hypothetical protein [Bifidobacterium phasiani]|uniref:Arcadin 1 domain-containing protein n=1 Tax=Bifidobacterium phasiani TaxID=2834431 RepID=A0ABS6W7C3_9BIFI|nr:hypothetical protein [Bifidobacterium phasiani]MBW3081989.1 hypothetical protein [Bifidobacterium phasiani]